MKYVVPVLVFCALIFSFNQFLNSLETKSIITKQLSDYYETQYAKWYERALKGQELYHRCLETLDKDERFEVIP